MNTRVENFFKGKGVEDAQLKNEFFTLILKANIIAAALFAPAALIMHKHIIAVCLNFIMLAFFVVLYLINAKTSDVITQKRLYMAFCIIENCLIFPLLYLTSGGIDSGLPLIFISGGISTILLLDNLPMILILLLNGLSFGASYLIEWNLPEFTQRFTVLNSYTYYDIALSTIVVGMGVGFILRTLTSNFDENQKKANELLIQIEESSTKDPLTGAYNRRFLMDYLDKCIEQTEKGEMRTFSIIMFDIDHFKKINDTYGHLAGDDCIKNLAYILNNSLRSVDIVSRYGGEEFICVLPTADDTPAFRRAEQIRASIEITQLSEDIDKKVTVSGGVAMYAPGMTAEQLINLVDKNLYIAKESGRNQVVWHNGGIPPLCYVAYDAEVLRPVKNAGRRFTDQSKPDPSRE